MCANEMDDPQREKLFKDLEAIEAAGEKLLSSQEKSKLLDINRRKSQEALNRLNDKNAPSQVWTCLSRQFFELPKESMKVALKSDLKTLESEVATLRSEIKRDLETLHELEGKESLKGFNLRPLTQDELSSITGPE